MPNQWQNKLIGLVRTRLTEVLQIGDLVCAISPSRMVLPISADQVLKAQELQKRVERSVRADAFEVPHLGEKNISVETQTFPWVLGQTVENVLGCQPAKVVQIVLILLKKYARTLAKSLILPKAPKNLPRLFALLPNLEDGLFGKAEFLMAPRSNQGRKTGVF